MHKQGFRLLPNVIAQKYVKRKNRTAGESVTIMSSNSLSQVLSESQNKVPVRLHFGAFGPEVGFSDSTRDHQLDLAS